MAARRRYTRTEKVVAIAAAEATSVLAAAEASGVPESTLRYWMDDPKFAPFRDNAREAMAEEARVVARMAWKALAAAIESGTLDGRDLVMAAGMATDKSQLLNGGATSRSEARDITGSLSDADLIAAVRTAERLTGAGGAAEAPAGEAVD
jgi:hypothetical protein